MAFDLYQTITDRILAMLDKGTVPWRHPIHNSGGGRPRNFESGKAYRGVNVFLLGVASWVKGYSSSYWMTYRQAEEKGGHVKKGEKSEMVVFWKKFETTDRQTGQPKTVPVLRYFSVFNADQVADVKPPDAPPQAAEPFEPLPDAEKIVAAYADGPKIEHAGAQAFYRPTDDLVRMPKPEHFLSKEFYYATMFHELAHSTGHNTRLKREIEKKLAPFGSADYSREELVAEMGSAFLCAVSNIGPPTIENAAAYIAGWRKKLSTDPKLVISAAGAGQRAADWILGQRPERIERPEPTPT